MGADYSRMPLALQIIFPIVVIFCIAATIYGFVRRCVIAGHGNRGAGVAPAMMMGGPGSMAPTMMNSSMNYGMQQGAPMYQAPPPSIPGAYPTSGGAQYSQSYPQQQQPTGDGGMTSNASGSVAPSPPPV